MTTAASGGLAKRENADEQQLGVRGTALAHSPFRPETSPSKRHGSNP